MQLYLGRMIVRPALLFMKGSVILGKKIQQIFFAGLAVLIPIGLTLYVFFFVINLLDGLLAILPRQYLPESWLHYYIPGLGVVATLALIFVSGLIVRSYIGKKVVNLWEGLFRRIPVVRSVYEGSKKVVDSMFVNKNRSFKKVVMVSFPHSGTYVLGFVTGEVIDRLASKIGGKMLNVFVPTTPNPTSGYLLMVPEDQIIEVDMTIEEAFTSIISCGIVNGSLNGGKQKQVAASQTL